VQRTAVAVHAALQGPSGKPIERLKTRSQFQAVLAGQVVSKTPHFALHSIQVAPWAAGEQNQSPQTVEPATSSRRVASSGMEAQVLFRQRQEASHGFLGAMIPKRWAKRAVTRNCIKRQIYAVSTEFQMNFSTGAHVVRLRSGFSKAQFVSATSTALKVAVRGELVQLFSAARTSRHQ
jgi:ribonuclease P protein component